MFRVLAKIIGILGLVTSTACFAADKIPEWKVLGASRSFAVEIDLASIDVKPVDDSWQIYSRIRVVFFKEFLTKNKKVAAYSITDTIAMCKEDKLVFTISRLYDKDGAVLDVAKGGSVLNPHAEDNFVSLYLNAMCPRAKTPSLNT